MGGTDAQHVERLSTRLVVTDEQRFQLDDQGYFITGKVFTEDDLQPVRAGFHERWRAYIEASDRAGVQQHANSNARERPFLARIRLESPTCMQFCKHPVMLELCRQLLGADADLSWDQAVIKPARTRSSAFGWHQDMWYAEHGEYLKNANLDIARRNDTGITVWAAISDTTIENGTLWVLPEGHKHGLLHHTWNTQTNDWQGDYDTSGKIPVIMEAGQIVVFRKYLPHSSGANSTDAPRLAYQIGYTIPGMMRGPSIDIMPVLRDGRPVE